MFKRTILFIALIAASTAVSTCTVANAGQAEDFTAEVNHVRFLQGSKPLAASAILQQQTDEHAALIQKHGCDLFRSSGLSVSSLGIASRVRFSCNGTICILGVQETFIQSVRDEVASLSYRSDNGGIFKFTARTLAVSIATCPGKPQVIVTTAR